MMKLRGLGLAGDCAATPNDPVCIEFYGTVPSAPSGAPTGAPVSTTAADRLKNAMNISAISNQITQAPGTIVSFPTAVLPDATTPWYKSWLGLAGLGVAGYFGYKYLIAPAPKKAAGPTTSATPAPSGSIAGLFSARHRRRRSRRR